MTIMCLLIGSLSFTTLVVVLVILPWFSNASLSSPGRTSVSCFLTRELISSAVTGDLGCSLDGDSSSSDITFLENL